jgi:hypothetical protein
MTQSSAVMLLYAATTFLQQGSGVLAAVVAPTEGAAWVAGAALGAVVAAGAPPQAIARIAMVPMRTPSLLMCSSRLFRVRSLYRLIWGRQFWNLFSMRWSVAVRSIPVPAMMITPANIFGVWNV